MLRSTGPCVQAEFHSGLGNWLYISVEVGLVAYATNRSLVLPDFMHEAFRLPGQIRRPDHTSYCHVLRNLQSASGDRTVRKTVAAVSATSFAHARASMFRWMLGTPRIHVPLTVGTAIHLRTLSDRHCRTEKSIRRCQYECLRPGVLACIGAIPVLPPPIIILSDSRSLAVRTTAYLQSVGHTDVRDESAIVNASDHSGLSSRAAWDAILLWTVFARAPVRIASGVSTFSKSALLALPGQHNLVVDTRCRKAHASDGALFTCRRATESDLV